MRLKILIVEDDEELQKVLNTFLQNEGYLTDTAGKGSEALRKIERVEPNLVILDLMLPDIQGESVLQTIRKDHPNLPVIILTAKSNPDDIAKGLNLGANDYLAKPFAAEELLARIKARMTVKIDDCEKLNAADLMLDMEKMEVKRNGKTIELTKTEFELLHFMLLNKGRILSRDTILNHVWGFSTDVESRVVDVYMGYLRKKIDKRFEKKLIKNKRGFGYFLDQ